MKSLLTKLEKIAYKKRYPDQIEQIRTLVGIIITKNTKANKQLAEYLKLKGRR